MKYFYTLGLLILGFSCYAQTPTINYSTYGVTGECTGVVYGNGIYVASATTRVPGLSPIFTSADAKTWTPSPSGQLPTTGFSKLAFGNGVFVGIAFPASIYTSTDGANWTLRSSNISEIIGDLKFIQGTFYAVSTGTTILTSTDGINWAPFSLGITVPINYNFSNIAYGGGLFVISTTIPATRGTPAYVGVYYSATGEPGSWTLNILYDYNSFVNVMWLKDRFYAFADQTFVTSTDAIVWALPSTPLVDTLTDGTIGALPELDGLPVAFTAGDSVYLMAANFQTGTYSMEVSVDETHFKSFYSSGMIADGGLYVNGLYIIYGIGGIATSTDGIHFKFNSTSFTGLATNGSGFVAVGGGSMFSSPDFVHWTDQTPETNGFPPITTLLYTGTKYVAAGSGGLVYFSDDGTSWSNIQTPPYSFISMGYGAGRFVAGTNSYVNGNYMLTSSTDGINWSVVDTNYTFYYTVRYLNNNFFALGVSYRDLTGRVLHSADGLHWENITPAAGFPVSDYNDVMYDGTRYYFTGLKKYPGNVVQDLFTLSTTNPMDTTSYGAAGSIVNPAPGTSAGDYYAQFGQFVYHDGQFVGSVADRVNSQAYLAYSSDGMNWSTTPLNGPAEAKAILVDGDVYRIVGDYGGRYSVSFRRSRVTLFDFEVMAVPSGRQENSRLSWRTGRESDIAYFLVQHSLDAVHWDSIGRVTAAGDSPVKTSYQFTQVGPPTGVNYYRLGLTDQDGLRQWSPVRQVDIRDEGDIRLYPNPAKGVIYVQLPEKGPASLIVFNSAGQTVRQEVVSGYSVALDLRSLPSGIYHLVVFQGGRRYSKEFIIAK